MEAVEGTPEDNHPSDPVTEHDITAHQRDLQNAAEVLRTGEHPDREVLANRLDLLRLRLGKTITAAATEQQEPIEPAEVIDGSHAISIPWLPETHSNTQVYPGGP